MIRSLISGFSNSGRVWTQRLSPTTENIYEVVYGNGIFVGAGLIPVRSVDGINWTLGTQPSGTDWGCKAIAYGKGLFVMGVNGGTSTYRIFTSPDGITWTGRSVTSASGEYVDGIAYGNNIFVVSISNGENSLRISTSTNGTTWTNRTPPSFAMHFPGSKVAFCNGYFFILNGSNTEYARSVDGVTWTKFTSPLASQAKITYGNNLYVMTGYAGHYGVATSTNGTTWTKHTTAFTNAGLTSSDYIYASIFANGLFIVASSNGKLITSTDGINWTQNITEFGTRSINGIDYGNGMYVAVGSGGKIATYSE